MAENVLTLRFTGAVASALRDRAWAGRRNATAQSLIYLLAGLRADGMEIADPPAAQYGRKPAAEAAVAEVAEVAAPEAAVEGPQPDTTWMNPKFTRPRGRRPASS